MNYETYKEKILKLFLEDDEVTYEQEYTRDEKQEFLDENTFDYHEAYEAECRAYDKGDVDVFGDDNLKSYLFNLAFECHLYHQNKEGDDVESVKADYPMTLSEFTEKVTEELVKVCHNVYGDSRETTLNDLDKALEEDSSLISAEYDRYCYTYDKASGRDDDFPVDYPFNDLGNAVYSIRMWLYF